FQSSSRTPRHRLDNLRRGRRAALPLPARFINRIRDAGTPPATKTNPDSISVNTSDTAAASQNGTQRLSLQTLRTSFGRPSLARRKIKMYELPYDSLARKA